MTTFLDFRPCIHARKEKITLKLTSILRPMFSILHLLPVLVNLITLPFPIRIPSSITVPCFCSFPFPVPVPVPVPVPFSLPFPLLVPFPTCLCSMLRLGWYGLFSTLSLHSHALGIPSTCQGLVLPLNSWTHLILD